MGGQGEDPHRGKPDDPEGGEGSSVDVILPEGFGASFSEKVIRARFVRKVYAILLSQLAVTTAFVATFCFTPAIKNFYCDQTRADSNGVVRCVRASNEGFIMYMVSYVLFLVTYIALACCEGLRKRYPGNVVAMCVFTLSMSIWASSIAIYHDVWWVVMAIGITAALCLGLTLFSFQTKIDFTGESSMVHCSL